MMVLLKRTLVSAATAAAMIVGAAMPALAAPVYDAENNVVTDYDIPEYDTSKHYTLVMIKQDDDETTTGATTVTNENIYYVNQKSGGGFTVKPKIDSGTQQLAAGTYEIRIGGEDVTMPVISVFTIENGEAEIMIGDVNEDGLINGIDVAELVQYLLENIELSEDALVSADTNGDGEIDAFDAVQLVQYIIGNISEL